jgi:rhodanese-related sulfurtransferase
MCLHGEVATAAWGLALPSGMGKSVKDLVEAANQVVPRISAEEAKQKIADGALVVDVRDAPEVAQSGKVAGAVHIPRGMVEFRADPETPYYDKNFAKDKPVILYCAGGGRAALSGQALKEMGYDEVYNLGGFTDWTQSGGPIETA